VSRVFQGSGGGGGGGGSTSATQTPDSLRSNDTFETIIAVSEGPIEGLENGAKSFYIGDTLLQALDGSTNFSNFTLRQFAGDASPTYTIVPSLGGIASSLTVNTALYHEVPLIRSTRQGDMDFIDIRLTINTLYRADNSGTYGDKMDFIIQFKPSNCTTWVSMQNLSSLVSSLRGSVNQTTTPRANGNGFVYSSSDLVAKWESSANSTSVTTEVSGKTTSPEVQQYRTPVLAIDNTWDIKITKVSPESDGSQNFHDINWESYQEVTSGSWKFANTACTMLTGQATSQFSSIPQFSGIYKLLIIKVPTNYDPIAKTYTGTWDGTFKMAWTDNPAWCLYDIITNTRYGLSLYVPINADKWSFYEAAQWCDERVGDGSPRYTFNGIITDQRLIRDQLKYMAGAFNSVIFTDQNGTVKLKVDKDDQAIALFTQENITVEGFTYSFTDIMSRYNDITVTFNNPDYDWQPDTFNVSSDPLQAQYGVVPLDFTAVGCTSRTEAYRRARYKLITANTERMQVSFKTNRLGQYVMPFDIILIGDDDLGFGLTGRIQSYSGSTVNFRDPIYLEAGVSYFFQVAVAGGTYTFNVTSTTVGNVTSLTLDEPIPTFFPAQANFVVGQVGTGLGAPKPFRVLKVSEVDGTPDLFQIDAIEINRNKWVDVDNNLDLPPPLYSFLPDATNVPGPVSCVFTESFDWVSLTFYTEVEPVMPSTYKYFNNEFEVWCRPAGVMTGIGGFEQLTLVRGNQIANLAPGDWEIRVLPINSLGSKAHIENVQSFYFTAVNPKAPPADVTGLTNTPIPYGLILNWSAVPDLDTRMYQVGTGSTVFATVNALTYMVGTPPANGQVFWVKAMDFQGNLSVNAATTTVAVTEAPAPTLTYTFSGQNLILNWTATSGQFAIDHFEVSLNGVVIAKVYAQTYSMPITTPDARTFGIRAVDVMGIEGDLGTATIGLPPPSAVTLTAQVVENNVMLSWTTSTGILPIAGYMLSKGSTPIGLKTGTFTTVVETVAGTWTYWIAPVDTAGNVGTATSVTATTTLPSGYAFHPLWTSTFSGTVTNAQVVGSSLLAPIHVDMSGGVLGDTPLGGVNLITETRTASYVEIFDYGTVISALSMQLMYLPVALSGSVSVVPTVSVATSTSGPWTDYVGVTQIGAGNFRYVKVTLDFSTTDPMARLEITDLVVQVGVRTINDSGTGSAVSTDTSGTNVNFNVTMVELQSLTLTPQSSTPVTMVYNLSSYTSPTNFQVYAYNSSGARVSVPFSWSAVCVSG